MKTIQTSSQRVVTFIIPIACRNFVLSWDLACKYLSQTVGSILNSIDPRFAVVIVGHESPMDYLPKDSRLHFLRLSDSTPKAEDKNLQSISRDWMGKMKLGREYANTQLPSQYIMRMDADDFLSNRVVGFLSRNSDKAGFRISDGWAWTSDSRFFIQQLDHFDRLWCGSSIIMKTEIADLKLDIYDLSERMSFLDEAQLGSERTLFTNEYHSFSDKAFKLNSIDISRMPFRAAIYRVANVNSMAQRNFKKIYSLRFLVGKIRRIRFLTPKLRKEFALFKSAVS